MGIILSNLTKNNIVIQFSTHKPEDKIPSHEVQGGQIRPPLNRHKNARIERG